jgi:hypothetical protein
VFGRLRPLLFYSTPDSRCCPRSASRVICCEAVPRPPQVFRNVRSRRPLLELADRAGILFLRSLARLIVVADPGHLHYPERVLAGRAAQAMGPSEDALSVSGSMRGWSTRLGARAPELRG